MESLSERFHQKRQPINATPEFDEQNSSGDKVYWHTRGKKCRENDVLTAIYKIVSSRKQGHLVYQFGENAYSSANDTKFEHHVKLLGFLY